jgi:hypothetical protein
MKRPLFSLLAILLSGSAARAQSNPTFTYAKPDDAKVEVNRTPPVEWKAQVKGGLMVTSGNSQTTNGVVGATASRREGNNRLALEGGAAYGHSNVVQGNPDPAMPAQITSITRTDVETTNNWFAKGRYDRFFTPNNSGYASGQAAADKIAGKSFFGGGQIGYSRQVYKSVRHTTVAEIGYDYSYERYVQTPGKTLDPVSIHSARLFAGETLKLTPETGLTASVEAFLNLNREGKALNASTNPPTAGVDPFHDTRVVGKLGATTTLFKKLSIGFGFTVRYDQNPAPLPLPALSSGATMFATGFQPFAAKVDTLTELNLIYTFL